MPLPVRDWRTWNMPPRNIAAWLTPPPRAVVSETVPSRASMIEFTGIASVIESGWNSDEPFSLTRTVPAATCATTVRPMAGSGTGWKVGGAAGSAAPGPGGGEGAEAAAVVKVASGPIARSSLSATTARKW